MAEHPDKSFADQPAWQAHLDRLGIAALTVPPNSALIATEGALWGSIKAHGFLPDTVLVSEDAGQFAVGRHALCWIHAKRLVHKRDTFTDRQRAAAPQHVPALIWWFYRDLKASCRDPTPRRSAEPPCAPASTASSSAAPAVPRSLGCSLGSMPTKPSC